MSESVLAAAPSLKDYLSLLKPRVMSLVVFSAFTGMYLALSHGSWHTWVYSLLFISLGAGASGAINMWYDADIDSLMSRTLKRAIPQGRISPENALRFGVILSWISVLGLAYTVGVYPAALLSITIGFYVFVYTMWLKRSTPHNIVIGGASGALPPVIGWACLENTVTLEPLLIFLIIFMWTPPHFWALSLYCNKDYKDAGVPMLPVLRGDHVTRMYITMYALALVPITLSPTLLGFRSLFYGVVALLLNGGLLYNVFSSLSEKTDPAYKRLFGYSIAYLFWILMAMILDKMIVGY